MSPFSETDGLDGFRECNEVVSGLTDGFDDMVYISEDGVGQSVGLQELPDIFDWVQFGSA